MKAEMKYSKKLLNLSIILEISRVNIKLWYEHFQLASITQLYGLWVNLQNVVEIDLQVAKTSTCVSVILQMSQLTRKIFGKSAHQPTHANKKAEQRNKATHLCTNYYRFNRKCSYVAQWCLPVERESAINFIIYIWTERYIHDLACRFYTHTSSAGNSNESSPKSRM